MYVNFWFQLKIEANRTRWSESCFHFNTMYNIWHHLSGLFDLAFWDCLWITETGQKLAAVTLTAYFSRHTVWTCYKGHDCLWSWTWYVLLSPQLQYIPGESLIAAEVSSDEAPGRHGQVTLRSARLTADIENCCRGSDMQQCLWPEQMLICSSGHKSFGKGRDRLLRWSHSWLIEYNSYSMTL